MLEPTHPLSRNHLTRVIVSGLLAILLTFLLFHWVDTLRSGFPAPQIHKDSITILEESPKEGMIQASGSITPGRRGFHVEPGTHWWRMDPSFGQQAALLEVTRPDLAETVLLWKADNGEWSQSGISRETPLPRRPVFSRTHTHELPGSLEMGQPLYLMIEAEYPAVVNLNLWNSRRDFHIFQQGNERITGFYYGIIAILLLVNGFVFWSTRVTAYLWYAIFLFFHAVSIMTYEGLYAGTPIGRIQGIHQMLLASIPLTVIFALKFLSDFLELKRSSPRLSRFVHTLQVIFALLLVQLALLPFPEIWKFIIPVQSVLVMATAFVYPAMAAWRARSGNPAHLLIFVTFLPHLIAVILFAMQVLGLAEADYNYFYKLLASSLFEMLMISAALGLLLRNMRRESEKARAAELTNLKRAKAAESAYRSKLEEQVKARTAALTQANEDKDQLLSILAHDLRSPLNSVVRYAEFAIRPDKEYQNNEYKDFLSGIHKTAKNLYDLLENLLAWAKTNWSGVKAAPQETNLKDLLEKAVSLYRETLINKNVRLHTGIEGEPLVYADSEMVLVIIRNLLSNAAKHVPGDGCLDIGILQEGDQILLRLDNSGEPISPEQFDNSQPEAKFSSRKQGQGLGLGLILCHELAVANKGSFKIFPLRNGTRAELRLPASGSSEADPP